MKKHIRLSGKQLIINGKHISFNEKVSDILLLDDIIIALDFDDKSANKDWLLNNVYGFDYDGNRIWVIQDIKEYDESYKSTSYIGLLPKDDETIQVNDYWGKRFFVDIRTGTIVRRNTDGRDF